MKNSPTTNSLSRSPVRHDFILIAFAGAVFALAPIVMAVDPPPDGGYEGNNTAEGEDALFSLTVAGQDNTAIGFRALYSLQGQDENTAVGSQALFSNVNGKWNTAVGFQALYRSTGFQNTAVGHLSLCHTTTGTSNTAIGAWSLFFNTTGNYNTATGWNALDYNKTGNYNTATGMSALGANHSGDNNTATGSLALSFNTNGNSNSAHGDHALYSNLTGSDNTATGSTALEDNTTGGGNTAVGSAALASNTAGGDNTAVGNEAGSSITGSGNVCIGAGVNGFAGESDITRIRNVYGSVATDRAVYVTADNKIGTLSSSRRYKEEITPMNEASDALFALKPVTFRYKKTIDPARVLSFGLIAEEVAEISPELITRDKEGKPQTVRYDAVNAMLLNEFLKEHRKVEEQDCKLQDQGATIAELKKQVAALTAGLQKVSAQLEASNSAPQTVLNSQ
jgi:hypothetical protein